MTRVRIKVLSGKIPKKASKLKKQNRVLFETRTYVDLNYSNSIQAAGDVKEAGVATFAIAWLGVLNPIVVNLCEDNPGGVCMKKNQCLDLSFNFHFK